MPLVPELLTLLSALGIAAAVAALALAAQEAWVALGRRYLATLGATDLPEEPAGSSRMAGTLQFVRRTLIAFLARVSESWVGDERLARIEAKLRKAGKPGDITAPEFVALIQVGAALGFMAALAVSLWLELSWVVWPAGAAFGACYPLIWRYDKTRWRHHQITRALPYNLDLLTLSVEAGLDFAAALGKVVEKGRKGPLADELALTLREIKLGKTREEALKNLAARADLPSLTHFVQALVQADKMGTSLGKVLRILSTQMRMERTQRAEKLANEAPVKLLLPLIFFIFPTIFFMLFGPIFHSVFFAGD